MINIEYILTLLKTRGLGRKTVNSILSDVNFEPQNISELHDIISEAHNKNKRIKVPSMMDLEASYQSAMEIINDSMESGILMIQRGDISYPSKFENISDPPSVIYVKGNLECLSHQNAIAIIGTREPTDYGIKCGEAISKQFVEKDFVIVSGLAKGCDTAAHRGCLNSNGLTIAILAHGLHMTYPAENKDLVKEILDNNGCLVSEYPIGVTPRPKYFIERDRLQSGISDAVFVIETDVKGGTMYAVNASIEENKPVACLKHPEKYLSHPKVQGNVKLISESKAIPIFDEVDINNFIKDYIFQKKPNGSGKKKAPVSGDQLPLFDA